jgi:hypothetical protein
MSTKLEGDAAHEEDASTPDPVTELSWSEATTVLKDLQNERKHIYVNIGSKTTPKVLHFVARQLAQKEHDHCMNAGQRTIAGRGEAELRTDIGLVRRLFIKKGVTSGPTGWTGSDADIMLLPPDAVRSLADAIMDFQNLDAETRLGFR